MNELDQAKQEILSLRQKSIAAPPALKSTAPVPSERVFTRDF